MYTNYATRRNEFKAAIDADQVEDDAMRGIASPFAFGLHDERLAGVYEEGDPLQDTVTPSYSKSTPSRWEYEDKRRETAKGAVAAEFLRRSQLLGDFYPFTISAQSVRYRGSRSLFYEYCLVVARAEDLTTTPFVRLPRQFERAVSTVVRLYLGHPAESMRVGAPTDEDDPAGHPKTFRERATLLARKTPSWSEEWTLDPEVGFEEALGDSGDAGLDIVAWKDFPDQRIGRVTMLGQCACGKSDQETDEKLNDLSLPRLKELFRNISAVKPIRFFATPYHVPNEAQFKHMHHLGGLALDRARIASIAESASQDAAVKEMRPRLIEIIRLVRPEFMPAPPTKGRFKQP